MENNFSLMDWLKENITRFALTTPKFFQIWQTIGTILLVITGLPEFFFQMKEFLGIDVWQFLPEPMKFVANKTIAVAGLVMLWMSKLPVKEPEKVIKKDSTAETAKLPFTARNK